MPNEHNLIPFSERTESEQREIQSAGGKKSGETRRRKRDMKAKMRMILDMPVYDCDDFAGMSSMGIDVENIDNETLMLVGLFRKAKNGDVQAVREIRSILGKDHAAAELAIRKEELKLKKEQLQSGVTGEAELPKLFEALSEPEEKHDTQDGDAE